MELHIGSNVIRNTSGMLSVQGQNQISIEIGERDNQILLTMDIYDRAGDHIAKLKRNAWVFNSRDKFEVTTSSESLRLTDRATGDIVVEVNVLERDKIQVVRGKFFTHKGNLLEITPECWRIDGGINLSKCTFDVCGGALTI